jgi:hypothetical protein
VTGAEACAALCLIGGFCGALVQCTGIYNGVKGVLNAIKRIPSYLFCVLIDTFAIAIILFIMGWGLLAAACFGVPPSPYSSYTTYTVSGYYGRPYDFSGLLYTPNANKNNNNNKNKKKPPSMANYYPSESSNKYYTSNPHSTAFFPGNNRR